MKSRRPVDLLLNVVRVRPAPRRRRRSRRAAPSPPPRSPPAPPAGPGSVPSWRRRAASGRRRARRARASRPAGRAPRGGCRRRGGAGAPASPPWPRAPAVASVSLSRMRSRGLGGLALHAGLDRAWPARAPSRSGRRVALEAQPHGLVELGRHLRPVVGDRRDRVLLLLERQLGERAVLVRQPAGEELVGADAERVDVRRRAGLLAARLLGREVGRRAEHRADLGDARLLGRLGDAEVGELRDAHLLGDEQVARLHVAVHHAGAVRVVEPVAGVAHHAHGLVDLELLALAQQVRARGPLDVLHDDVVAVGSRDPGRSRTPARRSGAAGAPPPAPRGGSGPRRPRPPPGARPAASPPPSAPAPCRWPGRPSTFPPAPRRRSSR